MKTWEVILPSGEITFVSSEDDQTPADVGYPADECTWIEKAEPATAIDSLKAGMRFDLGQALDWARAEIERKAQSAAASQMPDLHRQIIILTAWQEVQRLKLALKIPNGVPADLEQRRDEYPMIMALVHLTGLQPLDLANQIIERFRGRVREMYLYGAKVMIEHAALEDAAIAVNAKPETLIDLAKDAAIGQA